MMELYVWPAGFGLPSVDPESLQFMACVKMCAAPVVIRKTGVSAKPWGFPRIFQDFPLFRHGGTQIITEFGEFAEHLRKQIPDLSLDFHLAESKKSSLLSYKAFILENLKPAYLYSFWMDGPNFNTVTNRWFANQLPIPYSLVYTSGRRRAAIHTLHGLYPGDLVTDIDIEFATTRRAMSCINALEAKLGTNKHLFGDKPTSVDALVFGYLAPFLLCPLPNDRIQRHMEGCPNLVRMIHSMIAVYMPLSDTERMEEKDNRKIWEKRRVEAQNDIRGSGAGTDGKAGKTEEDDEAFRTRNKVMFGLIAAVLSVIFAIQLGFVQVSYVEGDRRKGRSTVGSIEESD